jgi:hypothetical protein
LSRSLDLRREENSPSPKLTGDEERGERRSGGGEKIAIGQLCRG